MAGKARESQAQALQAGDNFAVSFYVSKYINPLIGDLEVETFQNKQLRNFAEALVHKELAPKTIHELVGVVQQIIKSAQDENGNTLYVRNWNREFVLEGVPDIRDQLSR